MQQHLRQWGCQTLLRWHQWMMQIWYHCYI
jgi:hypothetical protein